MRVLFTVLAVSVLVMAVAGVGSGTLNWPAIIWQSVVISALAALVVEWFLAKRSTGGCSQEAEFRPGSEDAAGRSTGESHAISSLEEQGITSKLLELIALGERYGNPFSVALISLDHLDEMSEFYETDAIDELLGQVLNALAHTLRMPDRVGRFGRGTYVVMLPETNLPGAIQIAERLRAAVAEVDVAVSSRIHVHTTASVGITSFRRGDDLQAVLDRAQRTLREAQKQGHNRVLPDLAA